MKNNYSSSTLWLHVLERLKINDDESQLQTNDEPFLFKEIFHLTIKRGTIFKLSTHTVNDKIHIEIQFCQLQDYPEIENILERYDTTIRLTLINLPSPMIHSLFDYLFTTTKLTNNLEFVKICSARLKKKELKILIQKCKNLKTLMLPNCKIEQPINLVEIIKALPLLEHFDGLTTKGIGIPSNIFNFLLHHRRIMKTFLIWPLRSINLEQILGYLPFWESYIINLNPLKCVYTAGICIRLDSIFSSPLTDLLRYQKSVDFVSDITNMIYQKNKETALKFRQNNNECENYMVKSATRVRQIKEKCIYFELPTENNFMQN